MTAQARRKAAFNILHLLFGRRIPKATLSCLCLDCSNNPKIIIMAWCVQFVGGCCSERHVLPFLPLNKSRLSCSLSRSMLSPGRCCCCCCCCCFMACLNCRAGPSLHWALNHLSSGRAKAESWLQSPNCISATFRQENSYYVKLN